MSRHEPGGPLRPEARDPDVVRLRWQERWRSADLWAVRDEAEPTPGRGRHTPAPAPPPPHPPPAPHAGRDPEEAPEEDGLIRPFLVTGGRTWTAEQAIRVESLIRTVDAADTRGLRFEARRIIEICRRPTSLAELAVALRMPIGVIRVLVGDLVSNGTVTVVQVEEISLALLERIRDRVRAL